MMGMTSSPGSNGRWRVTFGVGGELEDPFAEWITDADRLSRHVGLDPAKSDIMVLH